jgi:hypothetical protein
MSCSKCAVDPGTHCFFPIGTLGSATVFYTSPARARIVGEETEESIQDIKCHLDTARGSNWILLLDCQKMKSQHQTSQEYTDKIVTILTAEHSDILERMIIIHPNIWIKLFFKLLKPFYRDDLINKMKMIDGKGEILIQKMRMIGFSEECLDNLGKILSSPFPPPLTTSTIPNTHSPQRK